jgi:DNA-binding CsgD family transcriptional regulator
MLLQLYGAVLDGAPLEDAFAGIVALVGGSSGLLQHASVTPEGDLLGTELAASPNMDPALMRDYASRWAPLDLWLIETLRRPGRLLEMDRHVSMADWERSALWNETRHMADAFHALTFYVPAVAGRPSWGFGIHRSRVLGAFGAAQLAQTRQLLPHLQQAVHAMLRRDAAGVHRAGHVASLLASQARPAALLPRHQAVVMHANPAFLALAGKRDGLSLGLYGRLQLADPEAQRRLDLVLAHPLGGELPARRPSGAMPLLLTVLPLPLPEGCLLLTAQEADAPLPHDPSPRLIALFNLTAAEAQLCTALLQGLSPQEHADARGVSITTVRSQIRAALSKTGQSRTAGLVALTARLASG